ncbi:MAG: dihydrofolate reductase [Prevotella sp.]|nr:dihydrofolate reductase [Prevotella sp.]
MTINIIAAVARNRAIGFQNKLLYWLPDDMKRFRQLTTGNTILMGRRTFESLPMRSQIINGQTVNTRALPHRRNCVLTRTITELPGCECFLDWESFIATCREDEDIYIIGGASIYAALLDKADRLCLTEVDDTPEVADAFFPATKLCNWKETFREHHPADERHAYPFDFVDYQRFFDLPASVAE